jgi:hypothetical protein
MGFPTRFESRRSTITCCALNPLTFYMHIGGRGDPVKMAETIRNALAVSKTPHTPPQPPARPPAIDLDTAQLDQIIGARGVNNGGVYAVNVPRRDPITEQGMSVGAPIMGGAASISFQAYRRRQGRCHR